MKSKMKFKQFITIFVLAILSGGLLSWEIDDNNEKITKSKNKMEMRK